MGRHIQSSFIYHRWRLRRLSQKGDSFPSPILTTLYQRPGQALFLTTLD